MISLAPSAIDPLTACLACAAPFTAVEQREPLRLLCTGCRAVVREIGSGC